MYYSSLCSALNLNRFKTFPEKLFRGLLNLQNLYEFKFFVFQKYSIVVSSYLSSNRLTDIPEGLFQGLYNLKLMYIWFLRDLLISLYLSNLNNNQLTNIPKGLFQGLANLETLY